jgi:hypothetical protein
MPKLLCALVLWLLAGSAVYAQQNQCRTSPVGASTAYCASEAFVTQTAAATPRFSASQSGNVPVTSGVFAKAQPDVVLFDTSAWYDGVTNFRYTPKLAGKYRISGVCEGVGTAAMSEVDADLRVNGSAYARVISLTTGFATATTISKDIVFNGSTDFVELFCLVAGGGTLVIEGGSAPIRTWFEGIYTGP